MDFTIPIQIELQKIQPIDIFKNIIETGDTNKSAFSFCLNSIIADISDLSDLLKPVHKICYQELSEDKAVIVEGLSEDKAVIVEGLNEDKAVIVEELNKDKTGIEKEFNNEDNSKDIVDIISDLFIYFSDNKYLYNPNRGNEGIDNCNFKEAKNFLIKVQKEFERIPESKIISEIDYNDFNPKILNENIDSRRKLSVLSQETNSIENNKLAELILDNDLKIQLPAEIANLLKTPNENTYDYKKLEKPSIINILINNFKYDKNIKDTELSSTMSFNKSQITYNHESKQIIISENHGNKSKNNNILINPDGRETDTFEGDITFKNDTLFKFRTDVTKKPLDKILNLYDIDEIKCELTDFDNQINKEINTRSIYENNLNNLNNKIIDSDKTKLIEKKPDVTEIPNIIKDSFVITKKENNFIEISLKPEGMGKLHIHLSLDNGVVHAKVDAFEMAGRDIINKNINDIVKVLLDDGINIGSFSINLKEKKGETSEYYNAQMSVDNANEKTDLPVISSGRYIINIFV